MRKLTWFAVLLLAVSVINYPNPFNPQAGEVTTIECTGTTTAEAFIYIYDMAARLLTRQSFTITGGTTSRTTWNGYNTFNELVGNGVYLYQIVSTGNQRLAKGKIWVINR